jgi:hypothetical protein
MISAAGRDHLFRYHRIERGTHVDGLVDVYPDKLEPIAPHFRTAFDELESWLDR